MHGLIAHLFTAGRELRRRPAITVAAWLALALGIALNTGMFGVVNGFLLRPLPVVDIDSLVRVREVARGQGAEQVFSLSPASFQAWREHNTVFSDMAAATGEAVTLSREAGAQRLQAAIVTANFFDVLGIDPRYGRRFAAGEDQSGANDVAVIGAALAVEQFGAPAAALGETLVIDGRLVTVVGVVPAGLRHPYEAEIWLPFAFDELLRAPSGNFLYVPARLKPGVDLATARAELDRMAAVLHDTRPDLGDTNAAYLVPLRDELLGTLRPVIFVLLAGSLLVLALATLNVVNLLYARSVSEQHENAVRIALGAGGRQLFGRALRRHLLLTLAAWVTGLFLCGLMMEPLLGLSAAASIDEFDAAARLDATTAGYALLLAVVIATLLAAIEARRAAAVPPAQSLGRTRDTSASASLRRRLGVLVMLQFAASFALAGAAVLVAGGYDELVHGDRGYDARGVTLFDLAFPDDRYAEMFRREQLVTELLARIRGLPAVDAAGAATVTPDYPGSWGGAYIIPGHEPPSPPGYELTNHRLASPGYLSALGVPLLAGRSFDPVNSERDAGGVVISREFAERYWGTPQDAIGRTFTRRTRSGLTELTVLGVVGDVAEAEQSRDWTTTRAWYLPLSAGTDYDFGRVTFLVRGGGADLPSRLRELVREVDPGLAPFSLMSMTDRLAETYSRERFSRFLFALFGLTACVIALVGLFSAQQFVTLLRRRELGLRAALGASATRIATSVVRDAMVVAFIGLVAGLPLLFLLVRLLRSYLPAVQAEGSGSLLLLGIALATATAMAALLPAVRAARIAPMDALRYE